jgi:hypothetical protein
MVIAMNTSDAKDLIELLAGRSAAWNALWTVFYTVGAAIVGVIATGKLISNRRSVASLIAVVGFLVFAVGNFKALDEMRKQRGAVVDFVKAKAQQANSTEITAVAKASEPPSFFELCVYHWTLSAFVVATLVFIPRFLGAPKDA